MNITLKDAVLALVRIEGVYDGPSFFSDSSSPRDVHEALVLPPSP